MSKDQIKREKRLFNFHQKYPNLPWPIICTMNHPWILDNIQVSSLLWRLKKKKDAVDMTVGCWWFDVSVSFNAARSKFYQLMANAAASIGPGYQVILDKNWVLHYGWWLDKYLRQEFDKLPCFLLKEQYFWNMWMWAISERMQMHVLVFLMRLLCWLGHKLLSNL